jgi:hypothetical protein
MKNNMKEMISTLKEAYKHNPKEFVLSAVLLTSISAIFYISIAIFG